MPYLKFTRDKRGYEYFQLVDQGGGRRGKSHRVLFAFRTPPNVKVGRAPFPEEVRRTLESTYPGVSFDWNALLATPIPSAEAERWRERRRAERAARRQAEPEEAVAEAVEEPEPGDEPEADSDALNEPAAADFAAAADVQPEAPAGGSPAPSGVRKRRRRRRRRGSQRPASSPQGDAPPPVSEPSSDPDEGV